MKVGFIGLGDQGLPIAERILKGGWPLTVWARRPVSAEAIGRAGADVVGSPEELAAQSDLIGICVATDDDVAEVVEALSGGIRRGSTVAIHSTVLPETCRRLQETLEPTGATVLDAPVSGGRTGAVAGTLSVMVGGNIAAFEQVRPVFESFGSPRHLGPLGTGQLLKLLNNAMLMAHIRLAYDALELATAFGVDRDLARDVLLEGTGGSAAMRTMIKFANLDMNHVRIMLEKDFGHFRRVIEGIPSGETIDRLGVELLDRLASGESS